MTAAPPPAEELAELLDEVRRIEVLGRRLAAGALAGGYASVFRGAGVEFDDVREYAAGDDVRTVDWNVTARVGRPHVKRFVQERELTVLFLLDLSPSMDGGWGPLSARRVAARVCACLGLSAVRNHDRTGLVAFGEGVESFVAPGRGSAHAVRIVRDCLALRSAGTRSDPAAALRFAARAVRRHAIVFLLSDFLADGWEDALARCARRHDTVAVRLRTPEEDLPARGLLRVRDPEGGRETLLDASSPALRAAWEARVRRWRERTAEGIRRAGADLLDVPVPRERVRDAVTGPLLEFFRMRERRGAIR